jgi:hypothetical protein
MIGLRRRQVVDITISRSPRSWQTQVLEFEGRCECLGVDGVGGCTLDRVASLVVPEIREIP